MRLHGTLVRRLVGAPWLVAIALVPLLALGWIAYRHVGTGFMPVMDEGGFIIDYRAPPGTSLSETNRLVRQVEAMLQATPDVRPILGAPAPVSAAPSSSKRRRRFLRPPEGKRPAPDR